MSQARLRAAATHKSFVPHESVGKLRSLPVKAVPLEAIATLCSSH